MQISEIMKKAYVKKAIIPAFNIPYLPMVEPVCKAIYDMNCIAIVQVARVEWLNFESQSLEHVSKEFHKFNKQNYTYLHLDHIPVIDENHNHVDYMNYIKRATESGFQSVMIDGSRLEFIENILATKEASDYVHNFGIACEAELGAVMGHESEELDITYDEIFNNRIGFTNPDQAEDFAKQSCCDWLSVAVGSIHGSVAENLRHNKKPEGKIDIDYLRDINERCKIPLVLHGGSGIPKNYIMQAKDEGITKINIATEIRQPYESIIKDTKNLDAAQERVYSVCCKIIDYDLEAKNSYDLLSTH